MKKYIFFMFLLVFLTLVGCQSKVETDLQKILETIDIPTEVTGDLDLKTTYSLGDTVATAEWQTTASSVMTKEGKINVTVADQNVTLILKLTIGENTLNKQYDIVVKGSEDYLVLYAVVQNEIRFDSFTIDQNLNLPSTYTLNDKVVNALWVSSNEEVLESDGVVHQQNVDVDVTLSLTLTLNSAIRNETYTFKVLQDPASLPVNWYHTADVWTDPITNEANDPATPQCFAGAVYRKVVSSEDYWLGIEAVVTIPEFIPDPDRFDPTKPTYFLDNASLYMGGHAVYESDIGLSWKIGYTDPVSKTLSDRGIAFRPFWRYITRKESCTNNNCFRNSNVNDFEYYYYPGDKIRMSVFSPKGGYLQMRIELLELTTIEKYVNIRAKYNLGDNFNRIFTTDPFPSEGMGAIKSEFKRVNAIDQVSNEGKPTLNTNAQVNNAIWHEVYLYRKINDELYKVPMTESRSASMTCPLGKNVNGDFTNAFKISYTNMNKTLGGEIVTLSPNNGTGKLYNVSYLVVRKSEEEYL